MPKKMILPGLAIALLVLLVGVLLLATGREAATDLSAKFPDTVLHKVVLSPESSGEQMRVIHLEPDGYTRERAEVWFRDGSIGNIYYRADGTISTFDSFYVAEDGKRQLKLDAAFDLDGRTYLKESHYRIDGSLSRQGIRIASGDYELRDFFDDGQSLAALDVFDVSGKRQSLDQWFRSGQVAKTVRHDEEGGRVTKNYAESGSKTSYHRVYYTQEFWEDYRPDGKTPLTRFEMKSDGGMHSVSYFVHAHYYNEDGSLDHERKFGTGYMAVIFRDQNGDVRFTQRWIRKVSTELREDMEQDRYVLQSIILGSENMLEGESIWFYDDGKTIEKRMIPTTLDEAGTIRIETRAYNRDGTLSQWSKPELVDGEVVMNSTRYENGLAVGKFEPEHIEDEWLASYPYALPPKAPYIEQPSLINW